MPIGSFSENLTSSTHDGPVAVTALPDTNPTAEGGEQYVGYLSGIFSDRMSGLCRGYVGILSDRMSVLRRDYVGIASLPCRGLCRTIRGLCRVPGQAKVA